MRDAYFLTQTLPEALPVSLLEAIVFPFAPSMLPAHAQNIALSAEHALLVHAAGNHRLQRCNSPGHAHLEAVQHRLLDSDIL